MLYARYEQNQLLFNMHFKGQTAAEKVVTLVDGLAKRKPKLDKIGLAEAMGIEVQRETRGAI